MDDVGEGEFGWKGVEKQAILCFAGICDEDTDKGDEELANELIVANKAEEAADAIGERVLEFHCECVDMVWRSEEKREQLLGIR